MKRIAVLGIVVGLLTSLPPAGAEAKVAVVRPGAMGSWTTDGEVTFVAAADGTAPPSGLGYARLAALPDGASGESALSTVAHQGTPLEDLELRYFTRVEEPGAPAPHLRLVVDRDGHTEGEDPDEQSWFFVPPRHAVVAGVWQEWIPTMPAAPWGTGAEVPSETWGSFVAQSPGAEINGPLTVATTENSTGEVDLVTVGNSNPFCCVEPADLAEYGWATRYDFEPSAAESTTTTTTTTLPDATTTSVPAPTTTTVPEPTTTSVPAPTTTSVPAPTTTSIPAPTTTSTSAPSETTTTTTTSTTSSTSTSTTTSTTTSTSTSTTTTTAVTETSTTATTTAGSAATTTTTAVSPTSTTTTSTTTPVTTSDGSGTSGSSGFSGGGSGASGGGSGASGGTGGDSSGTSGGGSSGGGGASAEPGNNSPGASTSDRVARVAGEDRITTAISISWRRFAAGSARSVVLARHDHFADALAGAPLAVRRGGPLLLTPSGALDPRVRDEVARVLTQGGRVELLGGEAALGAAVETQLRDLGFATLRHAGATRYDTAVAVAEALGSPQAVVLTTGTNFPDALSASAAAPRLDAAVLLTAGPSMPAPTARYLAGRATTRYAVGGAAGRADPSAEIVAGADRFETATAVARRFFPDAGAVAIASGVQFADALAGAADAGARRAPLLLSAPDRLPETVREHLTANASSLGEAVVYGGPLAVAESVLTQVQEAIR